jgi:signal transduction histidine kinase
VTPQAISEDGPAAGLRAPSAQVDDRMVCLMRLVLAVSALVIVYLDPAEPNRLVRETYAALVLYTLYSAALYALALRRGAWQPGGWVPWADVACYLVLVSLSSGTNSVFFFFFFFSILEASFRRGFASGLRVTLVSAALFTLVGYLSAPPEPAFELNRFLLRPTYLVVLGYMTAYWGGAEIRLKRRLALLKEVNTLSNPRFGVGHTVASMMKRVRAFYDADACLVLLGGVRDEADYQLSRVERGGGEASAERIPAELARQFLALPETLAAVYNVKTRPWQPAEACYYAFDLARGVRDERGLAECEALSVMLDARAFVTLPLLHRGRAAGRLFLTGRRGTFEPSDLDFLAQVVEHVMPVLSNVRLLDRLASKAAEQERLRIARDLHDSVIQPYIGLQYKLAAIRHKLDAGASDVRPDIEHLFEVTASEVTGLRRYVGGLKDGSAGRDDLAAALKRYTEQFQENYGIDVQLDMRGGVRVTDRLAAELIQMVHEGLRNVWKHTEATRCVVRLEGDGRDLLLSIENDGAAAEPFAPRSITERAEALGGRARVGVERDGDGDGNGRGLTAVRVRIPL